MLRARARHLANPYSISHHTFALIYTRRLQTLPNQHKDAPPPPTDAQARKPQVQLRPAPIKTPPQPVSATTRPPPSVSASPSPSPVVHTEESLSLKSLKETTTKDIADAEAHGLLVPPPPGAGWAKSTLHKVIQLAKFYYRGVKLVYTRQAHIVPTLRKRVRDGGAPLSRGEYRMLETQRADMKRLVPFVLIALILEEVIPLIVLYAPGMLPSTCILPSQRERIRDKATDQALALIASHGSALMSLTRAANTGEIPLESLSGQDIPRAICGLLGLSTSGIDYLRIRRIHRHLAFVEKDDALLAKEGVRSLSAQDLGDALRERGIVTRGLDSAQQVQRLTWWLKSVNEKSNTIARRVYLIALSGSR